MPSVKDVKDTKTTSQNGQKVTSKNNSGFPAPPQLSTPTDLTPKEVEKVVTAVNPLVADAFALYVKTKNFHWHLSTSHFREYHLMLDQQAGEIFESIDPMAERIRRIGGTTIRSITHISALQTISDDNKDFVEADDMIAELLKDNQQVAKNLRSAIDVAEDNRDTPTSNLLQDVLDKTERRIWFLFETHQGGKYEL